MAAQLNVLLFDTIKEVMPAINPIAVTEAPNKTINTDSKAPGSKIVLGSGFSTE